MNFQAINGINWPVAEQGDFDTIDAEQTFFVMEDEDGEQYFAYGHIPEAEMNAEVTRYLEHMLGPDDYEVGQGWFKHVYAKFVDQYGERFSWEGATAETLHAFPLTVVSL